MEILNQPVTLFGVAISGNPESLNKARDKVYDKTTKDLDALAKMYADLGELPSPDDKNLTSTDRTAILRGIQSRNPQFPGVNEALQAEKALHIVEKYMLGQENVPRPGQTGELTPELYTRVIDRLAERYLEGPDKLRRPGQPGALPPEIYTRVLHEMAQRCLDPKEGFVQQVGGSSGGVYILGTKQETESGKFILIPRFVFKPLDQEPGSVNNPTGARMTDSDNELFPPGEGGIREMIVNNSPLGERQSLLINLRHNDFRNNSQPTMGVLTDFIDSHGSLDTYTGGSFQKGRWYASDLKSAQDQAKVERAQKLIQLPKSDPEYEIKKKKIEEEFQSNLLKAQQTYEKNMAPVNERDMIFIVERAESARDVALDALEKAKNTMEKGDYEKQKKAIMDEFERTTAKPFQTLAQLRAKAEQASKTQMTSIKKMDRLERVGIYNYPGSA